LRKTFGCHATKKEAVDQIGAIESSKKRQSKSGIDLAAEDKIRSLAAELGIAEESTAPPIMIASDGSPEGTVLFVHGQPVPFKHFSLFCDRGEDYADCSISVTIEESDVDGMKIEKRLTLRKDTPLK
jgi:hypothetical protein